jgi:hypothetical protein
VARSRSERAKRYRNLSEEIKTAVEGMQSTAAREALLQVAHGYERLADALEQDATPRDMEEAG